MSTMDAASGPRVAIRSYRGLHVYQLAYSLAMEVYHLSKNFPKEELYSLTDQLLRSSRSIVANLVEGWAKRHYENTFKRHLIDSMGSSDETRLWLDVARDCGYISSSVHKTLWSSYGEVGKMLHRLFENWKTYK